jgi:hypothetical protein
MKDKRISPDNVQQLRDIFAFLLGIAPVEKVGLESKKFLSATVTRLLGDDPEESTRSSLLDELL